MRKLLSIFIIFILVSCEDVITPDLPTNEPILVVDAWLTNLNEPQKIVLSKTQDYLDSTISLGVNGASVIVKDDLGNNFEFIEENRGEYVWTPLDSVSSIGEVGTSFFLNVVYEGKNIVAQSELRRTATIDSVNFVKGGFLFPI